MIFKTWFVLIGILFLEHSTDHLETKRKIEILRETFGEDNWLHRQGGSCLQDVLGLPPTTVTTNILGQIENNLVSILHILRNFNNAISYLFKCNHYFKDNMTLKISKDNSDSREYTENNLKDLEDKVEAITVINKQDEEQEDEQVINDTDLESDSITEVKGNKTNK